jgi:hypothetical protein
VTEFQRLCQSSPNPLTRELLQAGLGDRAPERGAERALVALGVGVLAQTATAAASAATAGAVTTTTTTTAVASSAAGAGATAAGAATAGAATAAGSGGALLGSLALSKLFALGAAGGIGFAGGAAWLKHEAREPAALVREAPAPRATAAEHAELSAGALQPSPRQALDDPSVELEAPGKPEPVPTERRAAARLPGESGTARNSAASAAQPSPPQNPVPELPSVAVLPRAGGTLAREVALIDAARQALNAGAPPRALAELERYERERVTGTLDREALLIRIDALALSGQRAQAASLARDYLARYPMDAHAARLRALSAEP